MIRTTLGEAGDLTAFSWRAISALPRVPRYTAELLRHTAQLVRGTSLLLLVMNGFIGFTVGAGTYFLLRALGATDYTGLGAGLLVPRLGSVVMFGYVFAAKVGCGMTAEIGAAVVNDELDAMSVQGIDPYRYVVGTRVLGSLLYVPIAAAISLVGGFMGAYLSAVLILHGLSGEAFSSVAWTLQTVTDQLYMLVTVMVIGLTVVLVACFHGLRAAGGPAGVGDAVARSVAVNLVLLHLIAAFFAIVFYGTDPKLPIGG